MKEPADLVSASFALEDWGSRGLARATPPLARGRLAAWFPRPSQGSVREAAAR
jgi:hypothetical protein